ncbi:hemagglutinin [Mycoplasmopsis synoviae]|uniref:hemagglutinin n=1 Tax=Mycoplasmopsis synoviae TaxID=2109 RepID=UPI000CA1D61E|nr:hemagglutinin [Mycoplasmopsis synoviae]AQT41479.1 putative phase-variable hemagglutinin [Mycoplasmopsis synoviae]AWL84054.1 hemagglutinin [Mycoplasmopsis synoviae]QLE13780.1 hemagglutinin [Mycoplasmopsis synoviae]UZF64548.1 hemagglutinin [Mycoplasmopsis synoviae]UZF65219.1 hemagglutinin [Mycoplasmopsis synoviae]
MPKIVVDDYVADTTENNKEEIKEANKTKLQNWFKAPANWEKLSEQLTKKLGVDKFKNVKLTYKSITSTDFTAGRGATRWNPTVKFSVKANEGYTLDINSTREIDLVVRVLYKSAEANTDNVFTHEGASSSAAPGNTKKPNDPKVIKNVNVYLNYTGPSIVLDEALPTVGRQENTSINGTSNVTGEFNNAFRGNPSSGLLFTHRYANPLLKSVINYVNKFDPKYRATFVTNSIDGVTITNVTDKVQLRPGTLDDLKGNNVFLQQIKGDTEAVYFAVTAIASNKWLNTFLIRIPLTKFVRPISVFQATTAAPQDAAQASEGQGSQPDQTGQTA